MAIILVSNPKKTVNGIVSDVNAGRTQLPYTFQREDIENAGISSYSDNGGFVRLNLLGNVAFTFNVGDIIYVGGLGDIYGIATVTSSIFDTGTRIDTSLVFISNVSDRYVNYITTRPNYKVEIQIQDENNVLLVNQNFRFSPDPTGRLFTDVASILTELHEQSLNTSIQFILVYREIWQGSTPPAFVGSGTKQSIYAEKQLKDVGGSNMWEDLLVEGSTEQAIITGNISNASPFIRFSFGATPFGFILDDIVDVYYPSGFLYGTGIVSGVNVDNILLDIPYLTDEIGATISAHRGKILTVFENPLTWKGFARGISAIFDSDYATRVGSISWFWRGFTYDINKENQITGENLGNIQAVSVGTVIIPESMKDRYFAGGWITRGSLSGELSSRFFYQVLDPCVNPVYIGWVNSKGGVEQHLFSMEQEVVRTVEQGLLGESVINEDIENVNRTKFRLPNIWRQQMILTAGHLSTDQLLALAEIKQADFVVAYLSAQDLTDNIFVIVSNGYSTFYNTSEDLHEYSLQIEFPDNFNFLKAKKY